MADQQNKSVLTPEVLMELESIFMPHAYQQRKETYERHSKPGQTPAEHRLLCAHYTSAERALNIIRTKRIWMRNVLCVADYREVQHGFDILNEFLSDAVKAEAFSAALNSCFPNVAENA